MNAHTTQFSTDAVQQANQMMVRLLTRSATDPAFRASLLADPRTAIAEFTGEELPASYDIRFVENTADATVVLPDIVDRRVELSEAELEAVSGGITPTVAFAVVGAGVVVGMNIARMVDAN